MGFGLLASKALRPTSRLLRTIVSNPQLRNPEPSAAQPERPPRTPVKLKVCRWYQTGAHGWRINLWDPCLWIVISGHVAMTLGISAGVAYAENVRTEASSNSDPGEDLIGLRKIEDGSVVSNLHTAKWRVFTDKAREFFQQGKLDEAEKLFLSAIQEAKEGFGEQDPHVASACNNLVILLAIDIATLILFYF